jgi:hypothetical protein
MLSVLNSLHKVLLKKVIKMKKNNQRKVKL